MMPTIPAIVCGCLLVTSLNLVNAKIKVAAFNIKNFGPVQDKASREQREKHLFGVLPQIVERYDIIFIQEILDKKYPEDYMKKLIKNVNGFTYLRNAIAFGKSEIRKEYYAFMWRQKTMNCHSGFQYKNGKDFLRPPFGVICNLDPQTSGKLKSFGFLGIHIDYNVHIEELWNLYDAYKEFEKHAALKNIKAFLIGGDFNMRNEDCNLSSYQYHNICKAEFYWPLDPKKPTMVNTQNAHDRFIMAGDMKNYYMSGSAETFSFHEKILQSLPGMQANKISDHLPIELEFE